MTTLLILVGLPALCGMASYAAFELLFGDDDGELD
jgi:hypothetical protein